MSGSGWTTDTRLSTKCTSQSSSCAARLATSGFHENRSFPVSAECVKVSGLLIGPPQLDLDMVTNVSPGTM